MDAKYRVQGIFLSIYVVQTSLESFSNESFTTPSCILKFKHLIRAHWPTRQIFRYLPSKSSPLSFQLNVALSISLYCSPVIAFILYKRGFFSPEGGTLLLKFFSGLGAVYLASYVIRSAGRSQNSQYMEFLRILAKAQAHFSSEAKVGYGFDGFLEVR